MLTMLDNELSNAVDAYNKVNGTNYSVDQAREALDQ